MESVQSVTTRQLERYPIYLKYLRSMKESGVLFITSPLIARALSLTEEQVRKDLQLVSREQGKPNQGRDIKNLIEDIENFLGYNDTSNAVIVGVGSLGEAFMKYKGFSDFGLNILAGFDVDENKIGKSINSKQIFSLDKLENLVERLQVHIAILTVPQEAAQEVVEILEKSGIKGIWNFVPTHLNVSKDIVVQNVNLASSLAILSNKIDKKGR